MSPLLSCLTLASLSTSLDEPDTEVPAELECLPQAELECLPPAELEFLPHDELECLPVDELVCLAQEELVCLHESENESSRVTTPDVTDRDRYE